MVTRWSRDVESREWERLVAAVDGPPPRRRRKTRRLTGPITFVAGLFVAATAFILWAGLVAAIGVELGRTVLRWL